MIERLYCTIDPSAPGLIRLTARLPIEIEPAYDSTGFGFSDPRIAWTLKVRDPQAALAALKRSLWQYREGVSGEYFRCAPDQARAQAIHFATLRKHALGSAARSPEKRDRFLLLALCAAFLISIQLSSSLSFGTRETLGLMATVLLALTVLAGFVMRRRDCE